jgi:hypothetical protein
VCGALGADDFVEIEPWGKAKLQWLRQFLRPEHGIASHDAFGQVFAAIDAEQFAAAFRRWVRSVLPALGNDEVVSVDVKSSRRSGALVQMASSCCQRHAVLSLMRATSPERSACHAISATLSRDRGRSERLARVSAPANNSWTLDSTHVGGQVSVTARKPGAQTHSLGGARC